MQLPCHSVLKPREIAENGHFVGNGSLNLASQASKLPYIRPAQVTECVNQLTRRVTSYRVIMPIYVTYFVQLLLIIHALKTGRDRYWIFILLFLPMVGGIAYLVVEIIPEFLGGVRGQRAKRGMQQLVDPGGDIRDCQRAWEQSPNAENGRRYAQALINAGRANDALEILKQARSGFFENDPTLLLLQGQAHFLNKEYEATLEALDRLKAENPEFRSPEGHLLYARALEDSGRRQEAIEAYSEVAGYFPGAEARYRLAAALKADGDTESAKAEWESMLNDARLAPAHFRKSQSDWLKASQQALRDLS